MRMKSMRKVAIFIIFFALTNSMAYAEKVLNGIYTAPNLEFSVKDPYNGSYVKDSLATEIDSREIVQFVDFFAKKGYYIMGFQSLDWLNPNSETTKHFFMAVQNGFSKNSPAQRGTLKAFREKEEIYHMVPASDDIYCKRKTINGHPTYQCSELVIIKSLPPIKPLALLFTAMNFGRKINNDLDPELFSITVINFGKRVAVAVGYGSLAIHNQFVASLTSSPL